MPQRQVLLIDACVLINLLATEEIRAVLEHAAQKSMICTAVKNESLYLRIEDTPDEKKLIDLRSLIEDGTLSLCEIETPAEEQLYVNFSALLDDGEAMSLAICLARNWHPATDEKKARRLYLADAKYPDYLVSTSQLVREWAEVKKVSPDYLRLVLLRIERRAHYSPPAWDTNQDWWSLSSAA